MEDDFRIVCCEACDGGGHVKELRTWIESHGECITDWVSIGEACPYCDGTGGEIIETQPVNGVRNLDAQRLCHAEGILEFQTSLRRFHPRQEGCR